MLALVSRRCYLGLELVQQSLDLPLGRRAALSGHQFHTRQDDVNMGGDSRH
jgi:hypothetical protein